MDFLEELNKMVTDYKDEQYWIADIEIIPIRNVYDMSNDHYKSKIQEILDQSPEFDYAVKNCLRPEGDKSYNIFTNKFE